MFHKHHMIPKHSKYFEYLGDVVEDEYYKVSLTLEGHASQHDILYKVFGNNYDKIACNLLLGEGTGRIEVFQEIGRRNGLKKPNDEAREKMRQAKLGRTHSEETKRKMSEAHTGRKKQPFSEEHKQKISDSLKGNTRRKNSKNTYKTSEETKQKLSEAAKRSWKKRKGVL